MDAKESRITEIMNELDCDHDVAECMFFDEISDKYQTDDMDVAETMFYADSQDKEEDAMLATKKRKLAEVARECYIADLMEDTGLDYEEADEMIKDFEEPEKLTELLYQTTVNFYQKEFEKKCM